MMSAKTMPSTSTKITMSVTADERTRLEAQAKESAQTLSNYIRSKVGLDAVKIGRPAKA